MRTAITLAAVLLAGCGPQVDTPMEIESHSVNGLESTAKRGRITITRIGVIEDDVAYDGKRGIYIITDTKTGREYIGLSGVGISDTGSHVVGRNTVSDER